MIYNGPILTVEATGEALHHLASLARSLTNAIGGFDQSNAVHVRKRSRDRTMR